MRDSDDLESLWVEEHDELMKNYHTIGKQKNKWQEDGYAESGNDNRRAVEC